MDNQWRPDADSVGGEQLRQEIELLNIPISAAAQLLGLSLAGLRHQMNGTRPVSRQTGTRPVVIRRGRLALTHFRCSCRSCWD
jgi:hypothetical protein